MDARTTAPTETVRRLREAKSWSQQHLADAAGISLRTVQRLEAEGSASAETRLAISAALGVPVQSIFEARGISESKSHESTLSALVFATSGAGALFVLALGSILPATVASHFGVSGSANAYIDRETFVAGMCVLVSALPSLVWWLLGWSVRAGTVSLPNASYWLAPEQRTQTERFVLRHGAWLSVLLSTFLCFVYLLVVLVNTAGTGPASLRVSLLLAGIGTFVAAVAVWLYFLERRFRRSGA